jgi:hypothetical protein
MCIYTYIYKSLYVHTCAQNTCVYIICTYIHIYIYRVSRGENKGYRIDIGKWLHEAIDLVYERTRENNLLMTSSVRHINDTNELRVSDP